MVTVREALEEWGEGTEDTGPEIAVVGILTQELIPFGADEEGMFVAGFLQDATAAAVISAPAARVNADEFKVGDVVQVTGHVRRNPAGTDLRIGGIHRIGVAEVPRAKVGTVQEICAGRFANQLVKVHGILEPIRQTYEVSLRDETGVLSVWLPPTKLDPSFMVRAAEGGEATVRGFALPAAPESVVSLPCGVGLRTAEDIEFVQRPPYTAIASVVGLLLALSLLLYGWVRHRINERRVSDLAILSAEMKKARDAALDASRAKSEFLANMSHEIRTPLNGVIGLAAVLKDSELPSQEQREYVDMIYTSGEALLAVLNDILDFSKIEAGQLDFEHRDFEVRDVVESVVRILSHRAESKGLRLVTTVDSTIPTVVGDAGRLRQVVLNLVSNAVKFSECGEIRIVVRREQDDGDAVRLRFAVSDHGIGVPAAVKEMLFHPFTQADNSTTRKHGGTGLGLTISRKLVERMDGEIDLESEEGKGSTFWFTVRLDPSLATEEGTGSQTAHSLSSEVG